MKTHIAFDSLFARMDSLVDGQISRRWEILSTVLINFEKLPKLNWKNYINRMKGSKKKHTNKNIWKNDQMLTSHCTFSFSPVCFFLWMLQFPGVENTWNKPKRSEIICANEDIIKLPEKIPCCKCRIDDLPSPFPMAYLAAVAAVHLVFELEQEELVVIETVVNKIVALDDSLFHHRFWNLDSFYCFAFSNVCSVFFSILLFRRRQNNFHTQNDFTR